ncbi:UbiA prenyltransferase [Chloroherpeton thalassium ATCC 35110]|uniref:UbiA prenyltransferase n=1 Tax=Chloroherpeton thalassium (strain ATCC 35110 / GB-78) TaxID=517418 RepID=B3QSK9_CHLT3|nr:decaprenyl-phosphate phosphoribosyltransferase [Chloroherpeton thalassium]ACF14056.1 UbiA prenyltransferase [Chloroherpeton thalassium ATCC 35110]
MTSQIHGFIALLRPKHWIKNVVVLLPLFFSSSFLDRSAVLDALLGFIFFSLSASSVYVVNDLVDVERDRQHPIKRQKRPIAAGIISPPTAIAILVVLYIFVGLSYFFSMKFMIAILGYMALNLAYSFYLKHQPILDIFTVAAGFMLRIYAGAQAIDVPLSSWMLITALSLSLYLASVKRLQEIRLQGTKGRDVLSNYSPRLVERYAEFSAISALVFYSLYCLTEHEGLILTIPLALFGMFRYWFLVDQESQGESPVDVVYTDIPMQITLIAWIVFILVELWPKG